MVELKQSLNVLIAQFTAQALAAQEGRVANYHLRFRPLRFHGVSVRVEGEDRVHLLDRLKRLEDRLRWPAEAVVPQSLNVADPDGCRRQVVRVLVQFDAVNLLRPHLREERRHVRLAGEGDDLLLQVEQLL